MKKKNRNVRNALISRFVKLTAVLIITGMAASGIFYAWAQMRFMMTGEQTDTVEYSLSELFTRSENTSEQKSVVN